MPFSLLLPLLALVVACVGQPCPFFGDYQCPEGFLCQFDRCLDDAGKEPPDDCAKVWKQLEMTKNTVFHRSNAGVMRNAKVRVNACHSRADRAVATFWWVRAWPEALCPTVGHVGNALVEDAALTVSFSCFVTKLLNCRIRLRRRALRRIHRNLP